METDGNISILVCGGQERGTRMDNKDCYMLNGPKIVSLTNARLGAASTVIDGGNSLLIIGGSNQGHVALSNNELVTNALDQDLDTFESIESNINLPADEGSANPLELDNRGVKYACLLKVQPNNTLLIGGQDKKDEFRSTVYVVDVNDEWSNVMTPLNPLVTARSKHACGILDSNPSGSIIRLAVVAGGIISSDKITDTVEMAVLQLDHRFFSHQKGIVNWQSGPQMPLGVSSAAFATTADGQKFFVVGGDTELSFFDSSSTAMFQMTCSNNLDSLPSCAWTKLDQELNSPSSKGIAMTLPSIPLAKKETQGNCRFFDPDRSELITVDAMIF